MANGVSDYERLEASARKAFEAARATVAGARKIAALWAAALGIVWLSGLEGILHGTFKQERSFREINSNRQEAERKIEAAYAGLVAEQAEVDRLTKLKRKEDSLQAGSTESIEYKIQEARTKLNEAEKARAESGKQAGALDEQDDEAQKSIQKWGDKLHSLEADREKVKTLEARKNQLADLNEKSKAWETDVRHAYQLAKTDSLALSREVNFELLGVKLKTPLLVAPVLWSVLLLGLLGYLILARARVVALCRQGLQSLAKLPSSSAAISDMTETLPPWVARDLAPAFSLADKQLTDGKSVDDQPWVSQIFGSKQARRTSVVLSYLIPLTALWLQLRVAWIGIELTRHLGSNRTRAITSLALLLATGAACWLASRWFVLRDTGDGKNAPVDVKNKLPRWLLACLVPILGAAALVWLNPSLGIKSGLIFQKLLWFLCVLSVLWMAVPIGRKYLLGRAQSVPKLGRLTTRRNAIVALSALLFVVVAGLRLRRDRYPRFRRRRRQERVIGNRPGMAGAGFYATVQRLVSRDEFSPRDKEPGLALQELNHENTAEKLTSLPHSDSKMDIVLHYVDNGGKVWAGGRLPRGPVQKVSIFSLVSQRPTAEASPSPNSSSHEESEAEPDHRALSPTPLISIRMLASGHFRPFQERVHLASASWAFEEAAVTLLRKKPFNRKRSEEVCQLLIFAINHDIFFKSVISRRPSYRLYDLLAGVCVRFKQDTYFEELMRLISVAEQKGLFRTRMAKWNDPQGSWRKRWRNRKRPLQWIASSGGVVF